MRNGHGSQYSSSDLHLWCTRRARASTSRQGRRSPSSCHGCHCGCGVLRVPCGNWPRQHGYRSLHWQNRLRRRARASSASASHAHASCTRANDRRAHTRCDGGNGGDASDGWHGGMRTMPKLTSLASLASVAPTLKLSCAHWRACCSRLRTRMHSGSPHPIVEGVLLQCSTGRAHACAHGTHMLPHAARLHARLPARVHAGHAGHAGSAGHGRWGFQRLWPSRPLCWPLSWPYCCPLCFALPRAAVAAVAAVGAVWTTTASLPHYVLFWRYRHHHCSTGRRAGIRIAAM